MHSASVVSGAGERAHDCCVCVCVFVCLLLCQLVEIDEEILASLRLCLCRLSVYLSVLCVRVRMCVCASAPLETTHAQNKQQTHTHSLAQQNLLILFSLKFAQLPF